MTPCGNGRVWSFPRKGATLDQVMRLPFRGRFCSLAAASLLTGACAGRATGDQASVGGGGEAGNTGGASSSHSGTGGGGTAGTATGGIAIGGIATGGTVTGGTTAADSG